MSPLRLFIEDGKFRDATGRQVVLRGINVAGDAKHPSSPNIPSHVADDFYDGDHVNFHKRPFPREDAHLHFSRLKRMGYNTIRYVFTWEAIEAAGPGQYDEEWIQHTVETLRIAKQYGFYVFMDPHQDVVSGVPCSSQRIAVLTYLYIVVSFLGRLWRSHVDAVCGRPQSAELRGDGGGHCPQHVPRHQRLPQDDLVHQLLPPGDGDHVHALLCRP